MIGKGKGSNREGLCGLTNRETLGLVSPQSSVLTTLLNGQPVRSVIRARDMALDAEVRFLLLTFTPLQIGVLDAQAKVIGTVGVG